MPWALCALGLLAAARLAAGPLIERWSRRLVAEAGAPGAVTFRRTDLFTFPPVYVVESLTFKSGDERSSLAFDRVEVHTSWRQLAKGLLTAQPPVVRVRLARPRLLLAGEGPGELAAAVRAVLGRAPAANVELLRVEAGEARVGADSREPWLANVGLTVERMVTAGGVLHEIEGGADLLSSGRASFHLRATPAAHDEGELVVRDLSAANLHLALEGWTPVGATPPSIGVTSRFVTDGAAWSARVQTEIAAGGRGRAISPALVESMRARLGGAAPWVRAERAAGGREGQARLTGTLTPAGLGRWFEALSIARVLMVEGLATAAELPVDPPAASSERPGGSAAP